MSIEVSPPPATFPAPEPAPAARTAEVSLAKLFNDVFSTLASLKMTVILFAAAIFVVLAGTLAQVDDDIWNVMRNIFRTSWTYFELKLFFPRSFFPDPPRFLSWTLTPKGFYFPGGWMIGWLMLINLAAAYVYRFKVYARGGRLLAGWAVVGFGTLVTALVIWRGHVSSLATNPEEYDRLWNWLVATTVLGGAALLFGGVWQLRKHPLAGGLLVTLALSVFVGLGCWMYGIGGRLGDPGMRVLTQLIWASVPAPILIVGGALLYRQRAGMVVIHAGVALIMAYELYVGITAVETQIRLNEGETTNYSDDIRYCELAILERQPGSEAKDKVVVVPGGQLTKGAQIRDARLPFQIQVVDFFRNATVQPISRGSQEKNPADHGVGVQYRLVPKDVSVGTDSNGQVDAPAAYVTLSSPKGEVLGTWLVSLWTWANFNVPEEVQIDGKTYYLALRFQRHYKPYSVKLNDVKKEDYVGTQIPMHYASEITLTTPDQGEVAKKIWMNNPLRYEGETFYQSGYHRIPSTGVESTTLSVVRNAGWMTPYVSCMMVMFGLMAHFLGSLFRFLYHREERLAEGDQFARGSAAAASDNPVVSNVAGTSRGMLWSYGVSGVVLLGALWMLWSAVRTAPVKDFDLDLFAKIPIWEQGRAKPIDALARQSLLSISGKQTYVGREGRRLPAIHWLLETLAKPDDADQYRVIRIDNLELLELLQLPRREGFRYSRKEVLDQFENKKFREAVMSIQKKAPKDRTFFDKKVANLFSKLTIIRDLSEDFGEPDSVLLNAARNPELQSRLREGLPLLIANEQKKLAQRIEDKQHIPLALPPTESNAKWQTFSIGALEAFRSVLEGQSAPVAAQSWSEILSAYRNGKPQEFNAACAAYLKYLQETHAVKHDGTPADRERVDLNRTSYEATTNRIQPFSVAAVDYIIAFVLAALGFLSQTLRFRTATQALQRSAFWLIVFALVVHTTALCGRMYISGRAPVTNLYSAAVFIGWACVCAGVAIEIVYRGGIGSTIAALAGYLTLQIAGGLEQDGGDTLAVLQAVLDTNFWLSTHVTTITLGYATTYVAGLLGIMYIVLSMFLRLSPEVRKDLQNAIYGTVAFSLLFSFVGTVLGGLWADDSWGRFWGWDPKENGALIIVLWNALIMHARWDGMARGRWLAILAVFGNIVVSWSFFGVNELGVGLHSYGFQEGTLFYLGLFVASQLAVIAVAALVPERLWASTAAAARGANPPLAS